MPGGGLGNLLRLNGKMLTLECNELISNKVVRTDAAAVASIPPMHSDNIPSETIQSADGWR